MLATTFIAHDTQGTTISIECQQVKGGSTELREAILRHSGLLTASYTQTELHFAKTCPESVSGDFMLSFLAPLFADAHEDKDPDWNTVEQNIAQHLTQFFANFDWGGKSDPAEQYFFVTAKEQKTGNMLGVLQFISSPKFGAGVVKAALFGVLPEVQGQGVEQLLMSAIFRLDPNITRIFLHTRSTNTPLIELYQSWGFTQFEGPLEGWTDLEYLVDANSALQQTESMFK